MTAVLLDRIDAVDAGLAAISDRAERLTYGELRRQSRQVASRLHARHGDGQYLLVRVPASVRSVVTLLGVMYSGNTPIPVDPGLPDPGVAVLRDRSRAVAVLDPIAPEMVAAEEPGDFRRADVPVVVMFTSGTGGCPKGVLVSHANLAHSCAVIGDYLDYHAHRSAAVALPLHYSYALLSQVCAMLHAGGRVHLFSDLRNPVRFARTVRDEQLATFCGVPSTYHALATVHRMSPLSMPGVRVLCSAGAAMDRSKLSTVKEMFPNARFFNNYGMTEAAPRIAWIREDDPRFHEPTCGRPMRGVDVKVVDPDTLAPLPDGQTGILAIRGPNITAGYLHDPESTARAFTPDGYILSGDLAHLDRGYIFISGRHDDVFNAGGEKVAPLEIEHVLNHVTGVEFSAVAGFPDAQRGMAPVAFLKLAAPVRRGALVAELARHLPKAKIPQRFFEVTAFPMTANGKVQRKRLSLDDAERVVREIE
jgi:acyl-CoA synthetase (AMP-forming)/AMP-acid ligase II